jgi:hypothetical protein
MCCRVDGFLFASWCVGFLLAGASTGRVQGCVVWLQGVKCTVQCLTMHLAASCTQKVVCLTGMPRLACC